MKQIDCRELHREKPLDTENPPSHDETVFSNEDIVGKILNRNDNAKRSLATRLAALGLPEKSISRILNINPKASEK